MTHAAHRGLAARWLAIPLWQRILGALIVGAAVGFAWGQGAAHIQWIGDLFVR